MRKNGHLGSCPPRSRLLKKRTKPPRAETRQHAADFAAPSADPCQSLVRFPGGGSRKFSKRPAGPVCESKVFTKLGAIRPIVIPRYSEVPVFIIKNNLRVANISRDEYFRLL